jgi:hypothetical protein
LDDHEDPKTFDEAQRKWEQSRSTHLDPRPDKLSHKTTGPALIRELHNLGYATGDRRFRDAIEAIRANGLITEGNKWVREWRSPLYDFGTEDEIASRVDSLLQKGCSQELAFAINASGWGVKANSFEAAMKKVERIWRKSKGNELDNSSEGKV